MERAMEKSALKEARSHNKIEQALLRLPMDQVSVVDYYAAFVDASVLPRQETVELFRKRQDGLDARKEFVQGVSEGHIGSDDERFWDLQTIIEDGHEAEGEIIKHNLRLVVSIATKQAKKYPHYKKGGVLTFSDLVQEGIIGLKRAIEKYDVEKGFAFSTYATPWVTKTINTSILDNFHGLGIAKARVEDLAKVKRLQNKYLQEEGREPTKEEILKETKIKEENIDEVVAINNEPVSLDEPVINEAGSRTLEESIQSDVNVVVEVEGRLEEEDLMLGIILLEPKERKVLIYRYAKGMTLEEIGEKLGGITKEGIRYIQNKAIEKLKDILLRPGHIPA